MIGDLTIRDVTREVALDVESGGRGKDPWGNERIGFVAKTVDRPQGLRPRAGTSCSKPAACWSATASTSSSTCRPSTAAAAQAA